MLCRQLWDMLIQMLRASQWGCHLDFILCKTSRNLLVLIYIQKGKKVLKWLNLLMSMCPRKLSDASTMKLHYGSNPNFTVSTKNKNNIFSKKVFPVKVDCSVNTSVVSEYLSKLFMHLFLFTLITAMHLLSYLTSSHLSHMQITEFVSLCWLPICQRID